MVMIHSSFVQDIEKGFLKIRGLYAQLPDDEVRETDAV